MMESIKLGIVDDNAHLANQMVNNFSLFSHIKIVLIAKNGVDLLNQLKTTQPDLILMDVQMPEMDGITATKEVKARYPNIKILMLSVFDEDKKVFYSILAGASGYILKEETPVRILEAVENVLDGGASMSSLIAAKALNLIRFQNNQKLPQKPPSDFGLSKREMETLEHLADGEDYLKISESLFISPNTVKKHISNLYDKLHVHSRAEAVRIAVENQWV
ncbi:MAG: response regulator transcription factor [Marinoscillum sp.]|uniref:response regulator transcription factor n=1 Tax=Marinoscillum sp. TaxID=2024838 RepID=UPI003300B2EC